jgi:hypothetical protein
MNEVLVYINKICNNADGSYEYDFMFSDCQENVWGVEWDSYNPSSCKFMLPDDETITKKVRVKTTLPLKLAQETVCYSLEYATLGILALGWIDIESLNDYPEHGRMVFKFGDKVDRVKELLEKYSFEFGGE